MPIQGDDLARAQIFGAVPHRLLSNWPGPPLVAFSTAGKGQQCRLTPIGCLLGAIRAVLCRLLETGGLSGSRSTDCVNISPRVIEQPIIEYVPSTTADLLCIYYLASRCKTLCLARILTVI